MAYPKNLQTFCQKLSGYSRNNYRITTLNSQTALPTQFVVVDLPSGLIDLSTLTWFFNATTTTTSGYCELSRDIETILSRVEVEIGGQIVAGGGIQNYNHLFRAVSDMQYGYDGIQRRSVLQNAQLQTPPTANQTNVQFAMQTFLGLVSSIKPSIIDTRLFGGNMRLRLTLANNNILTCSAGAAGCAYSLSNMNFSIDVIDINDGVFDRLSQDFLARGGVLEMPFTQYFAYSQPSASHTQSLRASLSTGSLDALWGFFLPANYNSANQVVNTDSATSAYFTREATHLQDLQFSVNSQVYPNWRPTTSQWHAMTENALGRSNDTLGGSHPDLITLALWASPFFVAVQKFNHSDTEDTRIISGIDTRGTSSAITMDSTYDGTATSVLAMLYAQITSVLRVGAGGQIEIVQ